MTSQLFLTDGNQGRPGRINRMTGGITVVYSRIGDKADAVIKRTISSDRREWIVVTGQGYLRPCMGIWRCPRVIRGFLKADRKKRV